MRYRKYIFCLLALSSLAWQGCNSLGMEDSSKTVIKGNVHLAPGSKIYLYSYANTAAKYLRIKTIMDSAIVDQDGNYRFVLDWKNPSVFDLRAGNSFLVPELFLRPRDKMILNFTGNMNKPEIIPATKGEKYNDYLLRFTRKFYTDSGAAEAFYIKCNYMEGRQFSAYCKERKEQMLSFYENYFKNDRPDKDFSDFALAEIKYQDAAYRIKYLIKKRIKCIKVEVDSDYYNFSGLGYIKDVTALNSSSYFFYLNLYITNLYGTQMEHDSLYRNNEEGFIPSVEKFKLASIYMDSLPRKVVQFNIAYNEFTTPINTSREHYSKTIFKSFTDNSVDSLITRFQQRYLVSRS